jgi:hypothetical protein
MKNKVVKHRPSTWEKITGIKIWDPDGWRKDGQSWYKPIDLDEWKVRQMQSTCTLPSSYFSKNI